MNVFFSVIIFTQKNITKIPLNSALYFSYCLQIFLFLQNRKFFFFFLKLCHVYQKRKKIVSQ